MIIPDVRILAAGEIRDLLSGRQAEVIQTVRKAYEAHASGKSSLPHSSFLLFPDQPRNRIIALPAYLGDGFGMAGLKWISSFPDNTQKGVDRASAVIVLNSLETGRPIAVLEGSHISAQRTAASAALAAQYLHRHRDSTRAGFIGCGLINFEILQFLRVVSPELRRILLFDKTLAHAERFQRKSASLYPDLDIQIVEDTTAIFRTTTLISFATTASEPHIHDLSECGAGTTILHISLRDLAPSLVLSNDNIVDDIDHVCRAGTSLHLSEQRINNRNFIRGTLADVTTGRIQPTRSPESLTIFSPFGLGVLDLAVSKLVVELAEANQRGTVVESFHPAHWTSQE